MPSRFAKPERYKRFALQLQRIGGENRVLKCMRRVLESSVVERAGEITVEAAFEISAVVEAEGCVRRLGVMLRDGAALPVETKVEIERLRAFSVRERNACLRRLLSRCPDSHAGADGDPLADLLSSPDFGNQVNGLRD